MPVTVPSSLTIAVAGSELLHLTICDASAGKTDTVSFAVSPTLMSVGDGEIETDFAGIVTTRVTDASGIVVSSPDASELLISVKESV